VSPTIVVESFVSITELNDHLMILMLLKTQFA